MCTICSPVTVTQVKGWAGIWDFIMLQCLFHQLYSTREKLMYVWTRPCRHVNTLQITATFKCYTLKHGKVCSRKIEGSSRKTCHVQRGWKWSNLPQAQWLWLLSNHSWSILPVPQYRGTPDHLACPPPLLKDADTAVRDLLPLPPVCRKRKGKLPSWPIAPLKVDLNSAKPRLLTSRSAGEFSHTDLQPAVQLLPCLLE